MCAIIVIEHSLDTHCFALIVVLEIVSIVCLLILILLRVDFSKEALLI